jgi:hypothetical protein
MDTTLIHEICRVLDIKEQKNLVIKSQRYEEGAKLRDTEKQLLTKISKIMVSAGIINTEGLDPAPESTLLIEKEIDNYLLSNYGVSYMGNGTSKSLRRQLKLEEIFKKDY